MAIFPAMSTKVRQGQKLLLKTNQFWNAALECIIHDVANNNLSLFHEVIVAIFDF